MDLDLLLAYRTERKVVMKDRKLGMLNYGIMVAVVFYVVGFVLIINKGYIGKEQAIGQVKIQLYGGALMQVGEEGRGVGIAFDGHDFRNPSIESGAVFLTTRIDAIKQLRGSSCGNPDFPCDKNDDCPLYPGVSSQECSDGMCAMEGWCPAVGSSASQVYKMTKYANVSAWFRTSIQFPGLRPGEVFTNMDSSEPTFDEDVGETDAWPLDNILSSIGLTLADIGEKGAMINARLQWDCNVDTLEGCRFPTIQLKRLDSGSGYSYGYPDYERDMNMNPISDVRMFQKLSGIRILVVSKGEGSGFSWPATILQVSSALALLTLSTLIVDNVMKEVLNEKRHYRDYKEQVTPDFSDIRDIQKTRNAKQKGGK